MKKIYIVHKLNKAARECWLHLVNWLRLLILSLARSRTKKINGDLVFIQQTKNQLANQFQNTANSNTMKLKNLVIKTTFMLLLLIGTMSVNAQNPYPNTGNHTVCLGATEPYGVVLNAGSTYQWTVTPLASGNGTITAGATPNLITISWTTVGTATLQVVETNSFGCVGDPVTIIVTIVPAPTVVINNPPAVCSPGTVDLTAGSVTAGSTAGLVFTYWTDAAATIPYLTPTAATAGTYYIKGTTGAGCFDIKPVVVTVNPTPTLVITNPPSQCSPATVDLTAAAVTAGSTAGLTLTYWTDAAATIPYATPTAATAGTYYIKGTTGAGCFDIKPVVVTITASPTLVITNPAAVCSPATVDLTAGTVTAGSTPGLTLTYWTDAAATIPYATPTAATAGTYYIKGALAGGCFDVKPVTVVVNPLPTPSVTGPSPVCVGTGGATVIYSTSNVAGHGYNWSVTGGTITAGQGTNSITVLWTTAGPGTVTVNETITATGCTANNVKTVTVNPKPATSPISHN